MLVCSGLFRASIRCHRSRTFERQQLALKARLSRPLPSPGKKILALRAHVNCPKFEPP